LDVTDRDLLVQRLGLPEIAFSKIAGFDVTPRRPSASIRRVSSPLVRRLRRM
jgi:hypothetical protein